MSSSIVQSKELSSINVVPNQTASSTSSIRDIKVKKMSILDNVIFCAALCLIGGLATASQGAVNAKLGAYSGQGLSSVIVFCT
ncbi:hypothetical protein BG004_005308, partial [Podila humilis]